MGLLTTLVTLPLAPVRGAAWVAQQVAEEADRQMFDETRIRGQLLELELDHEEGRISEEERAALEDELLERLAVARQRAREEREHTVAMGEPATGEGDDG
ncbi:MAG: gas vesicle protein GvpG [Actinomycetota bacterium]|nr:gas vesicle protein GvpG [Actinomycetota bacterium]